MWLNAIKMEDANNFFEASIFYLKDASESLKHNSLVRAALSCSCAANCLVKIGDLAGARRLYLETAMIYEENADSIMGKSTREALWSLQEAYEYFLLASDSYKAQKVYDKCLSLARKVNPFFGEEETMQALWLRKKNTETPQMSATSKNLKISAEVTNGIEEFLRSRESSKRNESGSVMTEDKEYKNKLNCPKVENELKNELDMLRGKIHEYQNKLSSLRAENEEYKTKFKAIKAEDEEYLHKLDSYKDEIFHIIINKVKDGEDQFDIKQLTSELADTPKFNVINKEGKKHEKGIVS